MSANHSFLSKREVLRVTSLSSATLWRMEKRGDFPKKVHISPGRVGWSREMVDIWISEKMEAANAQAA